MAIRHGEQDALLALNAVPGLGSVTVRKLLKYVGSASAVFVSARSLVCDGVVPGKVASTLSSFNVRAFVDREKRLMDKAGCRACTFLDVNYPALLREIPAAPVVLYVRGSLLPLDAAAVAVVGSRRASVYGVTTAGRLSAQLSSRGVTVVSGLARGVDTAAHRSALTSGGRTVAVLGAGLSQIYPPENAKLAEEIARAGALVSEFPMEVPVRRAHFPRRNRIISGLSLGVVVVEAAVQSGALITSRYALEHNREVFAVPGPVDRPGSRGTHDLIRQGARLVETADDILEEIAPRLQTITAADREDRRFPGTEKIRPRLSPAARRVYDAMPSSAVGIDELSGLCRFGLTDMAGPLLELQLARQVRQLPGQVFRKVQGHEEKGL